MSGERKIIKRRGGKKEQREFREAGEKGKKKKNCTRFGRDHSARPCHRQPVCRCYNVQKVPVAHDLQQLDYGCQGLSMEWSGGREIDIIRWAIVFGRDCGEPGH